MARLALQVAESARGGALANEPTLATAGRLEPTKAPYSGAGRLRRKGGMRMAHRGLPMTKKAGLVPVREALE